MQQYDKALPDYQFVAGEPTNRFTEKATARCANILYYDKKDYEAAKTYYYKLETIATLEENKREYLIGLMRTNYKLKNYALCLQYVDKVKQLINLPEFYKKEISYYKGMAHFNIKEYDKAINDLQTTANGFNNEQGAEAQYSLAKLYYEKKNNKQAEAECMKYTDQFPAYEYYLGKTYILLSDIYVQKNNLLQAKATLQALVDNYSQQDDVMAEAKDKLQQIVDKENKKSNLKLPNTGTQLQFDNNQK